jgi:hypothetical protein
MRKFLEFALAGILVIVIGVAIHPDVEGSKSWNSGANNDTYTTPDDSIAKMYEGYVEQWKKDVKYSFNVAEKEVYGTDPAPVPIGPDPDPKKCICKGTGVIKQGDGHVTPCPYHGKQFVNPLLLEK